MSKEKQTILIFKLVITAVLLAGFSILIYRDFKDIQPQLTREFISFSMKIDRDRILLKTKLANLNHAKPSLSYLVQFQNREVPFDKEKFEEYVRYYNELLKMFPGKAEVFGILGYLYYHLGDPLTSAGYYGHAIERNDKFFWYYYNLGIIFYKIQEYEKAAYLFQKAVSVHLSDTVNALYPSKIYRAIAHEYYSFDEKHITAKMRLGYTNAFKYLVLCFKELNKYQGVLGASEKAISLKLEELDFFYYHMGIVYFQQEKYKEALDNLNEAVNINGQSLDTLDYLARVHQKLDNQDLYRQVKQRHQALLNKGVKKGTDYNLLNPQLF